MGTSWLHNISAKLLRDERKNGHIATTVVSILPALYHLLDAFIFFVRKHTARRQTEKEGEKIDIKSV